MCGCPAPHCPLTADSGLCFPRRMTVAGEVPLRWCHPQRDSGHRRKVSRAKDRHPTTPWREILLPFVVKGRAPTEGNALEHESQEQIRTDNAVLPCSPSPPNWSPTWLSSHPDRFENRHGGPRDGDIQPMLETCGFATMNQLIDSAVPAAIRSRIPAGVLPAPRSERATLGRPHATTPPPIPNRNYLGHRLLSLRYATGYPAQHFRKSRLVYPIHPLSGGNCPGST